MDLKQNLLEIGKKQLPELLKISDKSIKSTHHGRKAETDELKMK